MKRKSFGFLLLVVLLSACTNQQVTAFPIQIAMPTETIFFITPPIASQTPTPVSTFFPTQTPLPELTVPEATVNALATLDAIRVDLENKLPELREYHTFCNYSYCYGFDVSPNGQWVSFSNGNRIKLIRRADLEQREYSYYEIYGYQIDYRDGYIGTAHWTDDGQYLYLSADTGGDGGPEPYFNYVCALARVDLNSGKWDDTGVSGAIKFSPDEEYLVYSYGKEVRVRNLESDLQKIYPLPAEYPVAGKFVWSMDNERVIFIATSTDWYTPNSKFAFFIINIPDNTIQQILETGFPFYYPVDWAISEEVVLEKINEIGKWSLDLSTYPPTIIP